MHFLIPWVLYLQGLGLLFAVVILLRSKAQLTVSASPQLYTYDLVKEYPHDSNAFTQGIEFDRSGTLEFFWESTGKDSNPSSVWHQ